MIVEYIRYQIPEGEADAFEDAYRRACASNGTPPTGTYDVRL